MLLWVHAPDRTPALLNAMNESPTLRDVKKVKKWRRGCGGAANRLETPRPAPDLFIDVGMQLKKQKNY